MISVHFQGKPFSITLILVNVPTTNAEESEVDWFYEDLQDILELTHTHTHTHTKMYFHHRELECKIESQEIPGVTGKFVLGVQNEAGQRLREFCQEDTLVMCSTRQETNLHTDITRWPIPKSD